MNPIISIAMGLIVPLLSFYKDGFGIKQPMKTDMLLNEQTHIYSFCVVVSYFLYADCISCRGVRPLPPAKKGLS